MPEAKQWLYDMPAYDPPLEGRAGMVRLDFNENTLGPSPKVRKAISAIAQARLSCYPEYKGFAEKISKYSGVRPSQIVPTNGSDEAIKLVFDCFVPPKKEVIIPSPSYAMFYLYAKSAGAKIRKIPYNNDLSFPEEKVLASINNKTKLVVVCTPNNPTGTAISRACLERILRKARNAVVLVDEAYFEFSGKTAVPLIRKFNNLVITRTFSKAFGLAALRAGYIITNRKTAGMLKKNCSPYAVNYLARVAAEAVLDDMPYLNNYTSENRKNKALLESALAALGVKCFKSDANFLLADFGKACGFVSKQLLKKGILTRDRSSYPQLRGCLRITVGDKRKNQLVIRELRNIFEKPLLVFDVDGVLVDVSKSYRRAIKSTVEYFSKGELTLDEIQNWKNRTGINNDWELTKAILDSRKERVSMKRIVDKFQEFYLGKNFDGLIKNEKLLVRKTLLERLSQKYCLAVFTGRPREEAEFILDFFGIKDLFSDIVCMEDVPKDRQKPSPYGLTLIKKNTKFESAVYFGDTVSDVLAAKRAKNVRAIGVLPNTTCTKRTLAVLREAGAETVLKTINQIGEVVK